MSDWEGQRVGRRAGGQAGRRVSERVGEWVGERVGRQAIGKEGEWHTLPYLIPHDYLDMARGKQVSEDLAWVVVWLLALFPINEVSTFTGLSMQTICDIAALHASTRDPVKHSDHKRG